MKTQKFYFLILSSFLFLASCSLSNDRQFGIFEVMEDDVTVIMDGTITSNSLDDFIALDDAFPNITQINIRECDGSLDDEINLEMSLRVHEAGINTHLLENADIQSGGVDFFLAGIERTTEANTGIGVHSWADDVSMATDYPEGHEQHQPYIDYFVAIGFSQQEAEDFYYFTIYAAPAEDIHWMTEAEIEQYGIFTE